MRKIVVSGCSNCPYIVFQKEKDNFTTGVCRHPSFCVSQDAILPSIELDECIPPGATPSWCPLPIDDKWMYIPAACK